MYSIRLKVTAVYPPSEDLYRTLRMCGPWIFTRWLQRDGRARWYIVDSFIVAKLPIGRLKRLVPAERFAVGWESWRFDESYHRNYATDDLDGEPT